MFCPEGYYHFDEVWDFCNDLAAGLWSARVSRFLEPNSEVSAQEAFYVKELLCCWMLAQALSNYRVHLCSPDGHIVVAAKPILYHEDRLCLYDWAWSQPIDPALTYLLQRAVELSDPGLFFARFRFIDTITGTIGVAKRESRIREFASELQEDAEHQMFVASHFDGWALCFKHGHFPSNHQEFLEAVGLADEPRVVIEPPAPKSSKGRPALQQLARSAYRSAYPRGHEGTPWKVVAEEVAAQAGRSISDKTIKRALGQKQDNKD